MCKEYRTGGIYKPPRHQCIENICFTGIKYYNILYNKKGLDISTFFCDECDKYFCGDINKFKHCNICNYCYGKEIKHICIKNKFLDICSICQENLCQSKKRIVILKCGHAIHKKCINDYIKNIIYTSDGDKVFCPICRDVVIDIGEYKNYIKEKKINNICVREDCMIELSYMENMEMEIAHERQLIRLNHINLE